MPTAPPVLTDPGLSPDRADRATFSARSVARDDFIKNIEIPERRLALANVYANAVEAAAAAALAVPASTAALAAANYKGLWTSLAGALNIPASVFHNSAFWILKNNLANVAASQPGVSADWQDSQPVVAVLKGGTGDTFGAGGATIQRQTSASAQAFVDFMTIYNTTFNSYELELDGFLPTTNGANLLVQFYVAGVLVSGGYLWQNERWTTVGSGVTGQGGTGSGIALNAAGSDACANVGNRAHFVMRIPNCAQTAYTKCCEYFGSYAGSTVLGISGIGVSPGSGAVTGFRVTYDNGTIQPGFIATLKGNR